MPQLGICPCAYGLARADAHGIQEKAALSHCIPQPCPERYRPGPASSAYRASPPTTIHPRPISSVAFTGWFRTIAELQSASAVVGENTSKSSGLRRNFGGSNFYFKIETTAENQREASRR